MISIKLRSCFKMVADHCSTLPFMTDMEDMKAMPNFANGLWVPGCLSAVTVVSFHRRQ